MFISSSVLFDGITSSRSRTTQRAHLLIGQICWLGAGIAAPDPCIQSIPAPPTDRLLPLRVFRHYPAPLSPKSGIFSKRLMMSLRWSPLFVSGLMALGLALSGCAAPGPTAAGGEAFNDPLEDTNRAIFDVNQVIDRNVLLPAAKTYRTVLILPMRQAFHDFMQNLNAP